MRRIQVLLSAYNGEMYLAEQIESILAQKQVSVSLLIRDDGSFDATSNILKRYIGKNVQVYTGENIGTQRSFFNLLAHADDRNDYYAFSDQDDVWHPRKLQKAVEMLDAAGSLLYAGRVVCASQDLRVKKKWNRQLRKGPSFGNALVENICMGCTQVFSRQLLEIVRSHPPHCQILHDWWLYMAAAYFGTVVFDENAYMLYRQHNNNQVGMQDTWLQCQLARLHRAGHLRRKISVQAQDFADVYQDLRMERTVQDEGFTRECGTQKEKEMLLELAAGYRKDWQKKLAIITRDGIYRQNRMDQVIYKALFAMGYL